MKMIRKLLSMIKVTIIIAMKPIMITAIRTIPILMRRVNITWTAVIEKIKTVQVIFETTQLYVYMYMIKGHLSHAYEYTLPAKNMEYFVFQRLFAFLWSVQGVSDLKYIHTSRYHFLGS